ncbi:MAG: hypothetical protein HN356_06710 [Calditrichaeota bacterium]|jgi:hypothetical protein|nr:hypothetical protein [Calditrichota bacterium]
MRKIYPILFLILTIGCAPLVPQIGTVDFYPANEWDISMKIFMVPSHQDSDVDKHLNLIERKLIRIIDNSSKYTELNVETNQELADVNVIVECRIDTFLYQTPSYNYSTGYQTYIGKFLIGNNSNVTIPSSTAKKTYLTVDLWFSKNVETTGNSDQPESSLILLSTDTELITDQDPLIKAYQVLRRCLFALPGVGLSSFNRIPIINLPFLNNKFSGIRVVIGKNPIFTRLENKDIIFEIDGERIFDYLDYKAKMFSLEDDQKYCDIRYNRYGKIYSQEVKLKR